MLVAHDTDGVRQAALELLRASIDAKAVEARLKLTQSDDLDQLGKLVPQSKLAPGYHEWALYLLWLEASGLDPDFADEMEGLIALRRARHDFETENPQCPHCEKRGQRGLKHLCPAMMQKGAF